MIERSLALVLPAYNEEARLGPALDELFGYLARRSEVGRDGAPGDDLGDRAVVRVAVVGCHVAKRRQEVLAVGEGHPEDLDRAPGVRDLPVTMLAARLLPEARQGVAEGVQVQVEPQRRGGA